MNNFKATFIKKLAVVSLQSTMNDQLLARSSISLIREIGPGSRRIRQLRVPVHQIKIGAVELDHTEATCKCCLGPRTSLSV